MAPVGGSRTPRARLAARDTMTSAFAVATATGITHQPGSSSA